jgi:SpoVK/Ycf46/Vps4 family AAA+-type ATPase
VIAHELSIDLFAIDLSTIVSKYIGETEKNLETVFAAAAASNAVLFFDEADALFGKRTEVQDAHDRYANIETSYLLQRMETYDGIVILASNLRDHLDAAFTRRLQFVVDFPFPDATQRRRLWELNLPSRAPVDPALDTGELAEAYPLTGGGIRNVVVHAAFLAAQATSSLGMEQVRRAVGREYHKMGRVAHDPSPATARKD